MRYKKRPIVIDALKWEGGVDDMFDWADSLSSETLMSFGKIEGLFIETLEGRMSVSLGDFVICGLNGEFYPCKPDIFEMTYEEVGNE